MFDLGRLLATVAVSVVWFQLTVHLGERICNQLTPRYRTYPKEYQFIVKCRFGTLVYATYAGIFAACTFLWDNAIHQDHIRGYTTTSDLNMIGVLAYTATDLYCIRFTAKKTSMMKLHHLASIALLLVSMKDEVCGYFAIFRILTEISTPFLILLTLIKDLDLGGERVRTINGLVAVATFFLCRVVPLPFYYSEIYKEISNGQIQHLNLITAATWLIAGAILDAINLAWFYALIRGTVNVLTKKHSLNDIPLQTMQTTKDEGKS